MRLMLAAVGRLKDEAERALYDKYRSRFDTAGRSLSLGPLSLVELIEGKAATAELRKADEAGRLLKACAGAGAIVALDERGRTLSSEAFAQWLRDRRDGGEKSVAFLIGGPDGHGEAVLREAGLKLSLGPMTLPHGLARIVLAEQLYRAATLIAGHPYHRG
jgi:23S rRNA (pseudouridine1915-N3)-methyltransferase